MNSSNNHCFDFMLTKKSDSHVWFPFCFLVLSLQFHSKSIKQTLIIFIAWLYNLALGAIVPTYLQYVWFVWKLYFSVHIDKLIHWYLSYILFISNCEPVIQDQISFWCIKKTTPLGTLKVIKTFQKVSSSWYHWVIYILISKVSIKTCKALFILFVQSLIICLKFFIVSYSLQDKVWDI